MPGSGAAAFERVGDVSGPVFLRRERLLQSMAAAPVALLEAGAGFGKSVLVGQWVDETAAVPVSVALIERDRHTEFLSASVQRSLRAAGLPNVASAIGGRSDHDDLFEVLLQSLEREADPVLLIVEDAHVAPTVAGEFIVRLGTHLPRPHLMVATARTFAAAAVRLPRAARIGTGELAFTAHEVAELLAGSTRPTPAHVAARISQATSGWPAAVAVWVARLSGVTDPLRDIHDPTSQQGLLNVLMDDLLASLPVTLREQVAVMAHLPLLSAEVSEAVTGDRYALREAVTCGLPLSTAAVGWWRLPEPVAEYLRSRTVPPGTAITRAAGVYATRGRICEAIDLLFRARQTAEVAELLAGLSGERLEELAPAEVASVIASLPQADLVAHPRALLQAARALDVGNRGSDRSSMLRRLQSADGVDEVLAREVDAEQAFDLVIGGRSEGRAVAERVLAQAGPDEWAARSRALCAAGRAVSLSDSADGCEQATELLRESARCAQRAGFPKWASGALLRMAEDGLRERCRYAEAVAAVDEALTLYGSRPRWRSLALASRAEILIEAGRFDEARTATEEAMQLGRMLVDDQLVSYAAWSEFLLAACRGDAASTLACVRLADQRMGGWQTSFSGVGFLTDAADALDRVGMQELAREYLERARAVSEQDPRQFASAQARIEARSGDPNRALAMLRQVLDSWGRTPRRRWRLQLLDAYAAMRSHDRSAGERAATAFQTCADLGLPELPLWLERTVANALLPLAAKAGSAPAADLLAGTRQITLTMLGGFSVMRGASTVPLPPGRPTLAVKAVAAAGGRVHADELCEWLWPDSAPDRGRALLRNVLSRVRGAAGDLLVRAEDHVTLGPTVSVDALQFAQRADRALRTPDPVHADTLARAALAGYTGPLLPADSYVAPLATARERLRVLQLRLLDLVAERAAALGAVDDAIRSLEQAIEVEPYDESRYVRAAQLLAAQGRLGTARRLLRRRDEAMADLDVPQATRIDRAHR